MPPSCSYVQFISFSKSFFFGYTQNIGINHYFTLYKKYYVKILFLFKKTRLKDDTIDF